MGVHGGSTGKLRLAMAPLGYSTLGSSPFGLHRQECLCHCGRGSVAVAERVHLFDLDLVVAA